jgi:hypothetical protein
MIFLLRHGASDVRSEPARHSGRAWCRAAIVVVTQPGSARRYRGLAHSSRPLRSS